MGTPKYQQVVDVLERDIRSGKLRLDTPLPPIRELMSSFGYSLATINKALHVLEERGLIRRLHGKGVFVNGGGLGLEPVTAERTGNGVAAAESPLSIGVLSHFPTVRRVAQMWWAQILRGVDVAAAAMPGTRIRLINVAGRLPSAVVEQACQEGIEAFVNLGDHWTHMKAAGLAHEVRVRNLPAVMLYSSQPRPFWLSSVEIDDRKGVFDALSHLVSLGHRDLCFLDYAGEASWSVARRDAFLDGCELFGLNHVETVRLPADDFGQWPGAVDLRKLVKSCTAFVGANDDAAVTLLQAAEKLGLSAPGDFSLVGFDDDVMYRHLELTTVRQRLEDLGAEAVKLLRKLHDGEFGDSLVHLQLAPELVVRQTTGGN